MAADENQTLVIPLKALGIRLLKHRAGRGEVDGVKPFSCLLTDMIPTLVGRIGLHHCPMAAAVGIVVHLLLLVEGIVPNLVAIDTNDAPLLGTPQDGFTEHVTNHIGE